MSLNLDVIEMPHQAYVRKMLGKGVIEDEGSGKAYHVQKE